MHNTPGHPHLFLTARGLVRLLRPKQWIKNGFVLAPLLFTGLFLNTSAVTHALITTAFFCIAASAGYIVNDIQDVERDRLHPEKSKSRPLACGMVTVTSAVTVLIILYAVLILSWWFKPKVFVVLLGYVGLNIAYSFALKHQPVIDIFSIALGFVLRVLAGAVALNVPVSGWMFTTTLSLALYLAAIKRSQELNHHGSNARQVLHKYTKSLVDRYAEMSATCALVFYSLFVMTSKSEFIITIPLVLFGLYRYWYIVDVLKSGESPTDALIGDWPLIVTILFWVATCLWALWPQ